MDIVFLITDITTLGGVERTTLLLANELIQNGHKVKIVSLFKKNESIKFPVDLVQDVVYVTNRGYRLNEDSSNRLASILSIGEVILRFRKILKQLDSNSIYIAQCFLPAFILWLFRRAKVGIVCEHFKYELYNKYICDIRNRIYRQFMQVVTLTDEDYRKYHKVLSNVCVIPNMSPFPVTEAVDMHIKRIISVGRLTYQKGYDYLIDAVYRCKKQICGWTVHVYGDGELYEELNAQVMDKGINDIFFFEGYSEKIEDELANSSVFVLSSRFEGLPMVLLEAMAKGLAVISFDCPEGPRALLQNDAGILVEKENPNALADAITKLTDSYELRKEYSKNAQIAIKHFSAEKVVELWNNLFIGLKLL